VLIDSGRIEQFQSKRNGVVINKDNSADKYPEGPRELIFSRDLSQFDKICFPVENDKGKIIFTG